MLSGVFRFVLPELSSHFVLHDLQFFRLERPLSSSRVPPWDLLSMIHFEPLSSCSLRDLTQKILFLVALATARRVGELQAVSSAVSMSGEDMFLSYLPEFRAKTGSSSNPLPRSFCIRSLRDFVGDLPEELLLCPVRALRIYLSRTSSISPHPHSLFLSPRAPSRPLYKNALSFFLREVIFQASSSSSSSSVGPSAPSPSSFSARLSRSTASFSFCAHSVCGVAASVAFSSNAPLSSVLVADVVFYCLHLLLS